MRELDPTDRPVTVTINDCEFRPARGPKEILYDPKRVTPERDSLAAVSEHSTGIDAPGEADPRDETIRELLERIEMLEERTPCTCRKTDK